MKLSSYTREPLMTADIDKTPGVRPTPAIINIRARPRNTPYCCMALAGFQCDQWCLHTPMEWWLCGSCSPAGSRHPPLCDVKPSGEDVPFRTGTATIFHRKTCLFMNSLFCYRGRDFSEISYCRVRTSSTTTNSRSHVDRYTQGPAIVS